MKTRLDFDLLSRVRVRASRPLLQWARRTPWVRKQLLGRRASDLARGLDPDTAIMLELVKLTKDGSAAAGTPTFERHRMRMGVAIADDAPAGDIVISEHTVDTGDGGIPARLYEPRDLARPSPGVVHVHGGGWVTGDLETHDTWCRRLALVGRMRVLAIAPRLAPEHRFPATVDDTLSAFRYVARHADEFSIEPHRLGICGDSAGGNLSAIVGLETRSDEVRPFVTGLFYPAVDATMSHPSIRSRGKGYYLDEEALHWYLGHYIGSDATLRKLPRVSPFHASDVSGAPRALVVVAGFDPLVDEGVAYARRLEAAGTDVEVLMYAALIHGFLLMTATSEVSLAAANEVAARMGDMLRA